jgi:hypothetical protein
MYVERGRGREGEREGGARETERENIFALHIVDLGSS